MLAFPRVSVHAHMHVNMRGDESLWLVKRLVNKHIWCHAKPNGVERVFVSVLISPPVHKAPLKTINRNERIQSPCSLNCTPLIWDTYYCWLYLMDWIPTPHPFCVFKALNPSNVMYYQCICYSRAISSYTFCLGTVCLKKGAATSELCS